MTKDFPPASPETPDEAAPGTTEQAVEDAQQSLEDLTLTCVGCGEEFVFSVSEQEFFKSRDLNAPPKRCKACRQERRRARRNRGGRGGRMKDYRSPAFREKRKLDRIYRGPAFQKQGNVDEIYRSPAFQGADQNVDEMYRSPAFQSPAEDPNEMYRSPAFQAPVYDVEEEEEGGERAAVDDAEFDLEQGPPPGYKEPSAPHEIYRSPAFADTDPANYAPSYRRRQLHSIVCAGCGQKAKVPFKPQKNRPVYCKDCFQKRK